MTITETYQPIYSKAALITKMLGYKMNNHKEQYPPWRSSMGNWRLDCPYPHGSLERTGLIQLLALNLPQYYMEVPDIIVANMNRLMAQYMSGSQKGIGRNTRRVKYQLLVDRAVAGDCMNRLPNLSTAWIVCKKGHDSVPHIWNLECTEIYNISETLSLHQELNRDGANYTRG